MLIALNWLLWTFYYYCPILLIIEFAKDLVASKQISLDWYGSNYEQRTIYTQCCFKHVV